MQAKTRKEKDLWRWIRDGGLPGKWRRVEAKDGFPDAVCVFNHRTFLCELKEVEEWGRPANLGLRPDQAGFFLGFPGEAYILAEIGGILYWFDKSHVVDIRRNRISIAHTPSDGPYKLLVPSGTARLKRKTKKQPQPKRQRS
jgi:hypothetical protein